MGRHRLQRVACMLYYLEQNACTAISLQYVMYIQDEGKQKRQGIKMELKPEPVGICYLVHAVPKNIPNLRVKADHGTTIEWIQRPISGFCLHKPLHLLQQ